MRDKPSVKLTAANILGTLGYISLVINWAWAALVIVYPMIERGDFKLLLPTAPATPPPIEPLPINPLTISVMAIIVVVSIATAIYAIIKLPSMIGKTGARVTRVGAHAIIPTLTQHKPVSKRRRLMLTFRIIESMKFIGSLLPLLFVVCLPTTLTLSRDLVVIVAVVLTLWPIGYFGLQFLIVRLFKLDTSRVW